MITKENTTIVVDWGMTAYGLSKVDCPPEVFTVFYHDSDCKSPATVITGTIPISPSPLILEDDSMIWSNDGMPLKAYTFDRDKCKK